MRMRTIDQVAEYVRAIDPDTALTKTAIRRKVIAGEIPSSKAGRKYLLDLDRLEEFLFSPSAGTEVLSLMIERERREGRPILADNATGYYLPATEHERAACVRSMRHRAGEIMKSAQAIEQAER